MKFATDKDNSYSHYGTDGTIDFDDVFNENNQPFNHDYINGKWVINADKVSIALKNEILLQLDLLADKILYNERYFGYESYQTYKDNFIKQREELTQKLKGQ